MNKKELRNEILKLRDALSVDERMQKSQQIAKYLIEQKAFQEADKILLFASYKSEVETAQIFDVAHALNKDVYYPKVVDKKMKFYQVQNKEDLIEGYRGIREPEINEDRQFVATLLEKILVVMPGTVFDKSGNRIGYGGGYYDKYLQQLECIMPKENVCKIAVAFECQMVETGKIPSETYDVKPDYIITETRVISC